MDDAVVAVDAGGGGVDKVWLTRFRRIGTTILRLLGLNRDGVNGDGDVDGDTVSKCSSFSPFPTTPLPPPPFLS